MFQNCNIQGGESQNFKIVMYKRGGGSQKLQNHYPSKWCLKNINQRFQDCNIWARGGPSKREGIGSDTFLRNGSHKSEGTGTSPVAGIELEKGLFMKHIF